MDRQTLNPTEEMAPTFSLAGPFRFPMRVDPDGAAAQKGIATGDVPDLITIDNPVVASFATRMRWKT